MSALIALVTLLTVLPEHQMLFINTDQIGSAISSILGSKPEAIKEELPVSEDELPLWKEMLNAVMNETNNLDDLIYQEGETEDENDTELQSRFGFGKDDNVDCYGLPDPISKVLRFLFRKDETVNSKFFLSTRRNPEPVQVTNNLNDTDFDPRRRTFFIVHGFMSNGEMQWVRDMSAAILSKVDGNVFAFDWSEGGNSWMYWKAVANTRVAGEEACTFIRPLLESGLSKRNIHLIGHSLGAHICSYIGSHLGGVGRITGLDPAQPCFQENIKEIRLDPSDAEFIDIIHTNGRSLEKLGLGLPEPIGHVDFYPNGGAKQPGCTRKSRSILFPIYNSIKNRIEKAICSHGRSYMFFTESVKSADRCSFWGRHWDRKEDNANTTIMAPCNASNCTEMGIETEIFPARGSFYVPTSDRNPYCVRDPKTDSQMVASLSRLYKRTARLNRAAVF